MSSVHGSVHSSLFNVRAACHLGARRLERAPSLSPFILQRLVIGVVGFPPPADSAAPAHAKVLAFVPGRLAHHFRLQKGTPRHGADARQLPKLRASRSRTLAGGARRMMDCAAVSSAALWPRAKQTPAPVANVPRLFPRFLFLRQRIEM